MNTTSWCLLGGLVLMTVPYFYAAYSRAKYAEKFFIQKILADVAMGKITTGAQLLSSYEEFKGDFSDFARAIHRYMCLRILQTHTWKDIAAIGMQLPFFHASDEDDAMAREGIIREIVITNGKHISEMYSAKIRWISEQHHLQAGAKEALYEKTEGEANLFVIYGLPMPSVKEVLQTEKV